MKQVLIILSILITLLGRAQTNCHPVKTYLFDHDTQKEIEYMDVKLYVKSIPDDSSFTIDGRVCCLPSGKYNIGVEACCYLPNSSVQQLDVFNPNDTIELIFEMRHIPDCKEQSLWVSWIHFETKKCVLSDTAKKRLDGYILTMKNNPTLVIELTGHTDSQGSAKKNMKTSKCYVKTVKNYMVSKGVNPKRIVIEALGETQLLNRCKDGVQCTEEEHAQNRLVEFKIVRYDFKE